MPTRSQLTAPMMTSVRAVLSNHFILCPPFQYQCSYYYRKNWKYTFKNVIISKLSRKDVLFQRTIDKNYAALFYATGGIQIWHPKKIIQSALQNIKENVK